MDELNQSTLLFYTALQPGSTPPEIVHPFKLIIMTALQFLIKNRKKFDLMALEDRAVVFKDHIRKHAFRYFPGFEPAQTNVDLLGKQERPSGLFYQFAVSNDVQAHTVFVKVFHQSSSKEQVHPAHIKKPLLFPKIDAEERHWLQYTAHKAIFDYFTSLDNEQLGAIRVLDYLPEHSAFLTEGVSETSLRKLLLRQNLFFTVRASDDLLPVFYNLGKWLRLYHTMPKEADVTIRDSQRDDFIEAINKLSDFLVKNLGHEAFFRENTLTLTGLAKKFLPASLPLGLGHGDLARRNIFVGKNARVTVFDTSANWRTPIYKDIGHFLNDLKYSFSPVISPGFGFVPDQLVAYENSFLKGYFEKRPVPFAEIRLYETFALLDKWSSAIERFIQKRAFRKVISHPRIHWINHYSKRRLKSLVAEILYLSALLPEKRSSQGMNKNFQ